MMDPATISAIVLAEIEKITGEAYLSNEHVEMAEYLQKFFIDEISDDYNWEQEIQLQRYTTASEAELESKRKIFSKEVDNSNQYTCAKCKNGFVERYRTKNDKKCGNVTLSCQNLNCIDVKIKSVDESKINVESIMNNLNSVII